MTGSQTKRWSADGNLLAGGARARYHLPLMTDITQLLSALGQGDPHAAGRLLPLGYEELHKPAAQQMTVFKARQLGGARASISTEESFSIMPRIA